MKTHLISLKKYQGKNLWNRFDIIKDLVNKEDESRSVYIPPVMPKFVVPKSPKNSVGLYCFIKSILP